MDREERIRFITNIDRDSSLKQQDHIDMLEALELANGLNLDVYSDIYGRGALDGTNEEAIQLYYKWASFFDVLKSDNRYTVVINTYKEQVSGCAYHGKPQYTTRSSAVIIDGTAEFMSVKEGLESRYTLRGDKILHWHDGKLHKTTSVDLATTSPDDARLLIHKMQPKPKRILTAQSRIIVADTDLRLQLELVDALDGQFFSPYMQVRRALQEPKEGMSVNMAEL